MTTRTIAFQPATPTIVASTWPFNGLLFHARQIHRQHVDPTEVELATLRYSAPVTTTTTSTEP